MLTTITGWETLRPYQREAATALADGSKGGLWMGTGTGKTACLVSAWALRGLPQPALFITKALGRHVFSRDALWVLGADYTPGVLWAGSQIGPGVHFTRGGRTYTSIELALSENLGIATNYELVRPRFEELVRIPWQALLLDEVHELRGGHKPARKRDGTYHYLRYHRVRQLADLVRSRGGTIWTATATPVIDRRRDLFAQLDIVYPGVFGSSYNFLKRYCAAYRNEWGGLDSTGSSNSEELFRMIEGRFVIVRREDIADQLPEIQRDLVMVEPYLDGSASFKKMGGNIEDAIDRAANLKQSYVLDLAADYLVGGLKVVITVTRRRLARQLGFEMTGSKYARRLPAAMRDVLDVKVITGEIEARQRVDILGEFNAKPRGPAALVVTSGSIRESVDLHQTDGVIVAALPYTPGEMFQLEGRFSRLGGRFTTIHYPIAVRTIDEAIKETLLSKVDDIQRLQVGTQGSEGMYETLAGYMDEDKIISGLRGFLEGLDEEDVA